MDMSCNECREELSATSEAALAHLASCADCRAFARSWELLREYPAIEPSAGFFQGICRKRAPGILRFAAPLAAAAAALLIAILIIPHTSAPIQVVDRITDEERELVENLDLLENYDLVRTLEWVGEEEQK
jgi:hypothetical protein